MGIKKIDENTNVPLFAAISAVGALVGIAAWLVTVSATAANAVQVNVIQDQKLEMIYQIKEDVAVIKKILEKKGQ